MSVGRSVGRSVGQSAYLSVCRWSVGRSVSQSVSQSVCRSACLSVCPWSVGRSVDRSVSQSVCLSSCLSACLSVGQWDRQFIMMEHCPLTTIALSFSSDFLSCLTRPGLHDTLVQVSLSIRTTDQVYFPWTVILGRTHTNRFVVLYLTSGVICTTGGITRSYRN